MYSKKYLKEQIKGHKRIIKELSVKISKTKNNDEHVMYLKKTIKEGIDDIEFYEKMLKKAL